MSMAYYKRLDRLSSAEISQWKCFINSATSKISPFATHDFARAVMTSGRNTYLAFIMQDDGEVLLFPFEFRSFFDRLFMVASRVGGQLSDCMAVLSDSRISVQPASLLKLFHGVNFDHAPLSMWAPDGISEGDIRVGWALDLSGPIKEYWEGRKSQHKQRMANLENRRRKICRELGNLEIVETNHPTPEQVSKIINMKISQYINTGTGNVFEDPLANRLIENINMANHQDCQLLLSELYSGGQWIAGHIGLKVSTRLHFWFPVYAETFRSYSPGLLLLEEIINKMPENGLNYIDFGEGDSDYKRLFATSRYYNFKHYVSRRSIRGFLGRIAEAIRWRCLQHTYRVIVPNDNPKK